MGQDDLPPIHRHYIGHAATRAVEPAPLSRIDVNGFDHGIVAVFVVGHDQYGMTVLRPAGRKNRGLCLKQQVFIVLAYCADRQAHLVSLTPKVK